jgi:uncharacterized protein
MPLPQVPFARTAEDVQVEADEFMPGQVLEGNPEQGSAVLWESADGTSIRGVWQVTPGVFRWDFEADEMFVVLRGQARIEVAGSDPVAIGPGDMAIFQAGNKTIWHVTETIRKVFHITSDAS